MVPPLILGSALSNADAFLACLAPLWDLEKDTPVALWGAQKYQISLRYMLLPLGREQGVYVFSKFQLVVPPDLCADGAGFPRLYCHVRFAHHPAFAATCTCERFCAQPAYLVQTRQLQNVPSKIKRLSTSLTLGLKSLSTDSRALHSLTLTPLYNTVVTGKFLLFPSAWLPSSSVLSSSPGP